MSVDPETLAAYGRGAAEYARFVEEMPEDPLLERFIAAMPEGACVLDLGCGPGGAAARMAASGLKVTATDAAPEMVEMAAKLPGVSAHVATFDEIEGDGDYHGIWANFSLLHASHETLPRYIAALHRALKPGGLFHIAMKRGDGAKRDRLGRQYIYVSNDGLDRLLRDANFTPEHVVEGRDKGLAGKLEPWIAVQARA
jgi:SAM-dependent methyltransferase